MTVTHCSLYVSHGFLMTITHCMSHTVYVDTDLVKTRKIRNFTDTQTLSVLFVLHKLCTFIDILNLESISNYE